MKNTLWLKLVISFQLLTAIAHSLSFFSSPVASNETEKTLLDLIDNYSMDMGGGITRTWSDFFNALSAYFTLIYLFAGILNWYLMRKKADQEIMRGVIIINTGIFGISFVLNAIFTFWPPIILTGLVFLFLFISLLTWPKNTLSA